VTGNQDTGTPYQLNQGGTTWNSIITGDGGNPQVDNNQAAHPGTVIRYTSFSTLSFFNRTTWNNANTMVGGFTPIATNITNGPNAGRELANAPTLTGNPNITFTNAAPATITRAAGSWITDRFIVGQLITVTNTASNNGTYTIAGVTAATLTLKAGQTLTNEGPINNVGIAGVLDTNVQFYNPYMLNRIDPTRMIIGTADIYESTNQGDTLTDLSGFTGSFIGDGLGNSPISYGGLNANGTPNPGAFFVAAGATIYHRTADGNPVVQIASPTGGVIRAVVMDPENVTHVYVLGINNQVWGSVNDGATWTNLTANLPALSNNASVRTIELFSPDNTPRNTVLLVGGQGGVWQMRRPGAAGSTWTTIGSGLPKGVLVYDLVYDYATNTLIASTLGRGVWTLTNFFRGGGGTGNVIVNLTPAKPDPISIGSLDVLSGPIALAGNGPVQGIVSAPRAGSVRLQKIGARNGGSSSAPQPLTLIDGLTSVRQRSLITQNQNITDSQSLIDQAIGETNLKSGLA
jgi:hypothetical protein